jgi:MYXO-CTERM domain-containing protein
MRWRTFVVLAVIAVPSTAAAKQTTIDDFESASSPAPWMFSNGAEFPGATGALKAGPGDVGKGAALAYDFTKGGHYVAMTLKLPTPLTISAVGFSARASGVHTTLRVMDKTGQYHQYAVVRPLEAGGPDAWFRVVVDLTAPAAYWGGANDGVLHQPVTEVDLLAADGLQSGLQGVAGFDEVVAWDTLPASLDPYGAPLPAPAGSADLRSRLGVNIHFTSDDKALDSIQAAGFARVRMDLGWSGVETSKSMYDFSAMQSLVGSLASRGLGLHLILDYFNPLYPNPGDPAFMTTTVPAFASLSKVAAQTFAGKGVTYEVWNEENIPQFWTPPNATQYAALCAAAIAAVHAGDPTARVTTGGLSGFDEPFLEAALDAGAGVGADAIGVHPYRQGGAESASDDLAFMRSIVAGAYAMPPPVWDTEWGYSSTWYGDAGGHDAMARAVQAQRVSRELLSAWALGFPLAVYYDIRDDGTDPTNNEHNFGLLQNDYTDKPAMVAVRTLTNAASGRTFAGFLPVGFTSLHAMLLVGSDDRVVALWNDAVGSVATVSVPSNGTAVDMLGAPLELVRDGGATSVRVSEADGPVFLTYPNAAAGPDGGSPPGDGGIPLHDGNGGTPQRASGCGCQTTESGALVSSAAMAVLSLLAGAARRRGRQRRVNGKAL